MSELILKKRIVCINPNLVLQRSDLFTTGIVFMPFGLAYFAGTLLAEGHYCEVVDAFGENPNQIWSEGNLIYRGIQPTEIVDKVNEKSDEPPEIFFVYAINLTSHQSTISIVKQLRHSLHDFPIAILENTQAVTAYALENIQDELAFLAYQILLYHTLKNSHKTL
jgi:hypothetical protein